MLTRQVHRPEVDAKETKSSPKFVYILPGPWALPINTRNTQNQRGDPNSKPVQKLVPKGGNLTQQVTYYSDIRAKRNDIWREGKKKKKKKKGQTVRT